MKHLLFISLMALTLNATAQITLEKSYATYGVISVHNLENVGYVYMVIDAPNKRIYLFNESHSLWKTITPNFPMNTVFSSANYASTMLFDKDSDVEISINYYDTTGGVANWKYYTSIVEENGNLPFTINNCNYAYVAKVGNSWKFIAQKATVNPAYSDVYSLPGQQLSIQKPGKGGDDADMAIYPNPMQETATLAYTLPQGQQSGVINVYSSNGVLVRTYQVTNHFNDLKVQRNELPAGVYFYSLTTASGTGKAEMFVIR